MDKNKLIFSVVMYSIFVTCIFTILFWILTNSLIYSVSIPFTRGIFLILLPTLIVTVLTKFGLKFNLKKEQFSNTNFLFSGFLGGLFIGALGGGIGGFIWAVVRSIFMDGFDWKSIFIFSGTLLLYGAIIGIIFGTIGYPLIVKQFMKKKGEI